jgi:hypothetical protein
MRVLLFLIACSLWIASAHADEPTHTLDLSSRQSVHALVGVERPLKSGLILNVETQKGKVILRGRSRTGEIKLSMALVHPSAAPDDAIQVAGSAVIRGPGPALPDDVEEVVNRLRSSGRELSWSLPATETSESSEEPKPKYTNYTWLSVAGFALIVAAFWHHRRRMNAENS